MSEHHKTVLLSIELQEPVARAMAQLVKRAGFSDCRANAVDDNEAYLMVDGLDAVRTALANEGYAPR